MKVGDLIRYNAAGQRNKTLGLVLDETIQPSPWDNKSTKILLIQWCIIGDMLPRKERREGEGYDSYGSRCRVGEMAWYRKADYFEVVE